MKLFLRIYQILRPDRGLMIGSVAFGLLFSLVGLLPPLVIREVIRQLTNGALTRRNVLMMAAGLAIIYLLRGMFRYAYGCLSHKAAYCTLHRLLCQTYQHLQNLPPGFFVKRRSGELMSQAVNDVEVIEDFIAHGIPEFFLAAIMPLTMVAVLMAINLPFALMVFLPLPFLAFFLIQIVNRTRKFWTRVRGRRADLLANVLDRISGFREIKSFARENLSAREVSNSSEQYRDSLIKANRWSLVPAGVLETSGGVGYVLVIGWGGYLAVGGKIDVADLVVFIVYMGQIITPMLRLANLTEVLQKATASAERVFALLDSPIEPAGAASDPPHPIEWSIEFDGVDFQYQPDQPILRKVSFKIQPGELVALVGPTGVGKSTACQLIPRFYEVTCGSVRIGGHDVRKLPLPFVRENTAYVMQDVFLFHASIRENILFGRPDATEEEMQQAAREANVNEFVSRLPDGYETMVGERGARLSGGEKQRISIARAFLKNAPILLLDEATSSVDAECEAEIQEALSRLIVGRTVLVIAHRLNTVRHADRILVLEDGAVQECGRHEQLLCSGGYYSRMIHIQASATEWQVRPTL